MTGNVAVLVGCRLISIWYVVNTVYYGSAWTLTALQLRANNGVREGGLGDSLAFGILVNLFIGLLLWYAARWLARKAGPASALPAQSDITSGLLRTLGAYFVIASLGDIVQFITFLSTSDTSQPLRAFGGGTLAQSITYLLCGLLLIIGVDKIRSALVKVSRYGLDEPPGPATE